MSVLPLTPSVIQALRTDFRQGTWSATTQQFFQQLFLRVGGATSETNADLSAALTLLQGTVLTLQAAVDALEGTVTGISADFSVTPGPGDQDRPLSYGDLAPREERSEGSLGVAPREEGVAVDFDLGWIQWP